MSAFDRGVDAVVGVLFLIVVYVAVRAFVGPLPTSLLASAAAGLAFAVGVVVGIGATLRWPEFAISVWDGLTGTEVEES